MICAWNANDTARNLNESRMLESLKVSTLPVVIIQGRWLRMFASCSLLRMRWGQKCLDDASRSFGFSPELRQWACKLRADAMVCHGIIHNHFCLNELVIHLSQLLSETKGWNGAVWIGLNGLKVSCLSYKVNEHSGEEQHPRAQTLGTTGGPCLEGFAWPWVSKMSSFVGRRAGHLQSGILGMFVQDSWPTFPCRFAKKRSTKTAAQERNQKSKSGSAVEFDVQMHGLMFKELSWRPVEFYWNQDQPVCTTRFLQQPSNQYTCNTEHCCKPKHWVSGGRRGVARWRPLCSKCSARFFVFAWPGSDHEENDEENLLLKDSFNQGKCTTIVTTTKKTT